MILVKYFYFVTEANIKSAHTLLRHSAQNKRSFLFTWNQNQIEKNCFLKYFEVFQNIFQKILPLFTVSKQKVELFSVISRLCSCAHDGRGLSSWTSIAPSNFAGRRSRYNAGMAFYLLFMISLMTQIFIVSVPIFSSFLTYILKLDILELLETLIFSPEPKVSVLYVFHYNQFAHFWIKPFPRWFNSSCKRRL